jgi:hypothetical protein
LKINQPQTNDEMPLNIS